MKIKTYGMPGLLEWHGIVSAGNIKMKISFTNGTVTGYGVAPAAFTTKDELAQFVIEHSEQFKSGRIILIREMEVADDSATKARKARMAAKAAEKPSGERQSPVQDNTIPAPPAPIEGNSVMPTTPMEETPAEVEQPTGDAQDDMLQSDGEDADGSKVKVADKSEAIEYLKEHFADRHYTAIGLRAKTAFEAACKDCGVEFLFTS